MNDWRLIRRLIDVFVAKRNKSFQTRDGLYQVLLVCLVKLTTIRDKRKEIGNSGPRSIRTAVNTVFLAFI